METTPIIEGITIIDVATKRGTTKSINGRGG
jgi:hypothetical protein